MLLRMPAEKPADVDAYLVAQSPEARAALVKVREAMRRALPTSVEAIKYGMPAYLVDGHAVASFAGWKSHYALYFVSAALFEAIAREVPSREANKGIIRFDLDDPVPESVVMRLATWTFGDDAARAAEKNNKRPKKAPAPAAQKRMLRATATKRSTSRSRSRDS
jgi:uncharacterized protein YdhG (YjbR/CyaY superfamily)